MLYGVMDDENTDTEETWQRTKNVMSFRISFFNLKRNKVRSKPDRWTPVVKRSLRQGDGANGIINNGIPGVAVCGMPNKEAERCNYKGLRKQRFTFVLAKRARKTLKIAINTYFQRGKLKVV